MKNKKNVSTEQIASKQFNYRCDTVEVNIQLRVDNNKELVAMNKIIDKMKLDITKEIKNLEK